MVESRRFNGPLSSPIVSQDPKVQATQNEEVLVDSPDCRIPVRAQGRRHWFYGGGYRVGSGTGAWPLPQNTFVNVKFESVDFAHCDSYYKLSSS